MSRVFTENSANYLSVIGNLSVEATEFSMAAWAKNDTASGSGHAALSVGKDSNTGDNRRKWIETFNDTSVRLFVQEAGYNFTKSGGTAPVGVWKHLVAQRKSDGAGGFVWELYVDGTLVSSEADAGATGLPTGADDIFVGVTSSKTGPFSGKIAHAALLTRALTSTEVTDLAGGASPGTLTGGRYAYYPLTDSSLTNIWEADSSMGALTVTGTVANDDADNPTVTSAEPVPGLPSYTLNKDGSAVGDLTNVKVRVTATGELDGTQLYSVNNAATTAGVLSATDLSATAATVGDTVSVSILTGANEGITFIDVVEDIG